MPARSFENEASVRKGIYGAFPQSTQHFCKCHNQHSTLIIKASYFNVFNKRFNFLKYMLIRIILTSIWNPVSHR